MVLPGQEQAQHHSPGQDQPDNRRQSEPLRSLRLRLHESPRARPQNAVDNETETDRGQARPDEIEPNASLGRSVRHPPRQGEDHEHDDDLADENQTPREVRGEETTDQGTRSHRDGAGRRHQPVSARPFGAREVRRHQRDDRRHDQRRADSFEDRPPDDQHRETRRDRGREGTAPVDDTADGKGALAAEDLADLAAGDHERRHDQRVEGDGRLDPSDTRADVLGDGRDRDVHDRAVEGHQELTRGQRHQNDPGRACPRLRVGRLRTLSVRHSTISAQGGCARTGTKGSSPCAAEDQLGPSVTRPFLLLVPGRERSRNGLEASGTD